MFVRSGMPPLGLQVVGQLFELVACLPAETSASGLAETLTEGLLVVWCHNYVTHVEEDIVFFEDVLGEKTDVAIGGLMETSDGGCFTSLLGVECFGHVARVLPGELVLEEHDADRSSFAGDSSRLQHREQQVFLLRMMAGVGERSEEVNTPGKRGAFKTAAFQRPGDQSTKNLDYSQDDLMLGSQDA